MRNAFIALVFGVVAMQPGGRAVHLTLHEGTNLAAALSPDGRTIAMDLLGTLWTMPAGGGEARAITDMFMDARQPSWSPDGRRIAFQAYRTSTWQIWTINADGTDPKPVTSSPFDDREPAWSPDGAAIAFSSDRSGNYDIWTLTLASGALKQITSAPSNEYMPSWKGANEIAYVSDRRDKPGIYGAGDRLIAAADGALAAPAFGPDGTVAFNAIGGTHSRLIVGNKNIADDDEDVFPFRPQLVGSDIFYTADGKIKRRPAGGGAARTIEFSADVSFTRPAFTPKRHRFELSGSQPVRGIMHPVISPDGTQIAFAALGDLWVMSVRGQAGDRDVPVTRLMTDPAMDTQPAWSADGKSLAYASDRGGSMNIWIRDLASGADRQLTHHSSAATQPSWSPDGSRIAFLDAEGEIHVADAKSGADRKVHDRLNGPGRASWAPDGSALVVSSLKVYSTRFREGTNQVLRISLTGEPDRWFDPQPHKSIGMREDYGPIWSRDGSQMAAIIDGLLAVWPVARDGAPLGPPRAVATGLAGSPSWTADSRFLLYQSDTALKLVDVAARRIVREIDPHLTWTQAKHPGLKTIHAGRLWDGRSDALQPDMDIVVDGNRIKSVEKHRDALHAATIVDASDATVLPGIIEIHTHLSENFGEALGRIFLSWGITTVRNPATNTFEAMENREAVESGARVGPRLLTTGEPFDGTRIYYPGGTSLDDSGQLPLELQHAKTFDYDFVKTYVRLPDLMQKRIVDAAHAMGMPVTSHELYPAVAYGADGVEHIRGTSRRGYSPKISALSRSYRDVIDLLTASKMTLTPTIGIQGGFRLQTLRDASWIDDPRIQKLYPASVSERWREQTRTPASAAVLDEAQRIVAPQERTIFQVVRGGGRVTAGTDAPINPYGLSLLMELENYASSGLTPIEVLRTATMVSAEAMGVGADIGSIEPGKLADITIVDGNPLSNIRDLRRVKRVIKDGVVYEIDALIGRGAAR
jgi:Tol biopolymer transport system component/imidazolonepropionase-like amidohydrolase